jgi:pimeloyl-ACP methyl ester carboxylesterase
MRGLHMVTALIVLFTMLLACVLVGRLGLLSDFHEADVSADFLACSKPGVLFVLVHGLERGRSWKDMTLALNGYGDVLGVKYPVLSNADPQYIARKISEAVQAKYDPQRHTRILLIGQSIGALFVRRAFLIAEEHSTSWAKAVNRVVLLAGMNRGWDISGKTPVDMRWSTWLTIWVASWLGRLTGTGKLILATETGAPFVANLRLDWMKRMRKAERDLEVVQLLGDIDDVVSDEDNKDLRAMASSKFAWIRVRGTGHPNIADFNDTRQYGGVVLGDYRKAKFLLAVNEDFDKVKQENEEQPFQTDESVTHIVFVLHGIRDLGHWASAFEYELLGFFKRHTKPGGKLAVASIRYGYFGMGPFLLRPGRDKYVKWFMDEYTETLARYPKAEHIHFVGHSNGTYLLAAALERYSSLKVDRVVFGGSVVRKDYKWDEVFKNDQVKRLRNYVASDDWVVALFPRFFEPPLMRYLLGNDIGSAGFNGFESTHSNLENVRYIEGQHGAFLERIPEIVRFLLSDQAQQARITTEHRVKVLKWASNWGTWLVVWPLLAAIILFAGWHVVTSATEPRLPFLVLYGLLVLLILMNA